LSEALFELALVRFLMNSWITVFLGLIALGSVVQVAFLVALAVLGLRAARVAGEVRARAENELREPIAHVTGALRNVKDISAIVAGEARSVQDTAHHAVDQVKEAKDEVTRVVRTPWVELTAFAKGVATAVAVFRETPSTPSSEPPAAPQPEAFAPASRSPEPRWSGRQA
jgi:hypothetical protein